jgi:nitrate reductase NapAB chaperone NapD
MSFNMVRGLRRLEISERGAKGKLIVIWEKQDNGLCLCP